MKMHTFLSFIIFIIISFVSMMGLRRIFLFKCDLYFDHIHSPISSPFSTVSSDSSFSSSDSLPYSFMSYIVHI